MKIYPATFTLPKLLAVVTLTINLICASAIAAPPQSNGDAALKKQVAELQAKIKQLEAALPANSPQPTVSPTMSGMNTSPKMTPATSMPGMTPSGTGTSGAMGLGDMNKGGISKNPSNNSGTMTGAENGGMNGMMGQMMGMGGMSPAPGAASSGMPQSALPGFPGVSHLYHIGATGFFLDHSDHIRLSNEQQMSLNRIKEKAVAAKSSTDAQIEEAERELGTLTAADQPDAAKIEAKVREIEKLRTDQRLAFIRAVGDAANLLTDDQRKFLTGAMPSAGPSPSATMAPMSDM